MLENIGTSVLAGPDQLPSLHKLLTEAAGMLGMEAPDLYVRQNPVPNAYTLAIAGRKPFVVMHTALLELLSPAEVQVGPLRTPPCPARCLPACRLPPPACLARVAATAASLPPALAPLARPARRLCLPVVVRGCACQCVAWHAADCLLHPSCPLFPFFSLRLCSPTSWAT